MCAPSLTHKPSHHIEEVFKPLLLVPSVRIILRNQVTVAAVLITVASPFLDSTVS